MRFTCIVCLIACVVIDNVDLRPIIKKFVGKRTTNVTSLQRKKRYDYVDNYDWAADSKTLHYDEDEDDDGTVNSKETLFKKMAENWKTVGIRFIFIFSALVFCCFCCQCVCKVVCPHCFGCCSANCEVFYEWLAVYCCCGQDPAYKKFNKFAKSFGIEMDYETFQKVKKGYGFEGNLMDPKAQRKAAQNYV